MVDDAEKICYNNFIVIPTLSTLSIFVVIDSFLIGSQPHLNGYDYSVLIKDVHMPWSPTLTVLRNCLADRFPNQQDTRRLIEEVGIDPAYIGFDSKAINNWHEILRQAELRGKVADIVLLALQHYPGDQPLIDAFTAHMAALGQPANLPDALRHPTPSAAPSSQATGADMSQGYGSYTQINTGGGPYIAGDINTGSGDFVAHDKIHHGQGDSEAADAGQPAIDTQTELQKLLAQHERNLQTLRSQRAIYARGEETLYLLNKIEHEEQEIAKLKAQLD